MIRARSLRLTRLDAEGQPVGKPFVTSGYVTLGDVRPTIDCPPFEPIHLTGKFKITGYFKEFNMPAFEETSPGHLAEVNPLVGDHVGVGPINVDPGYRPPSIADGTVSQNLADALARLVDEYGAVGVATTLDELLAMRGAL